MSASTKVKGRTLLAAGYILALFGFYAAASAWLFPLLAESFDMDVGLSDTAIVVSPGPLIVWFAFSYCSIGIAIVLAVHAFAHLRALEGGDRIVGIVLFTLGVILSLALLRCASNAAIETLGPSFAQADGLAGSGTSARALLDLADTTKSALNAVFQVAAIAILAAFLLLAGRARSSEEDPATHIGVSRLFYLAAFLLTLIVLSDALFFDFVSSIYPAESAVVSFQRGLMIYFGILSTATLALALVASVQLGARLDLLGRVREDEGLRSGLKKAADAFAGSLGKTTATLAPVGVALISSMLENIS